MDINTPNKESMIHKEVYDKVLPYLLFVFIVSSILIFETISSTVLSFITFKTINRIYIFQGLLNVFFISPFLYVFMLRPLKKQLQENRLSALSFQSAIASYISSMKNIEEEKARYHALLNSIGDGVIATDHEGNVIFLNATAKKTYQYHNDVTQKALKWYDLPVSIIDEQDKELSIKKHPLYSALHKRSTTSAAFSYVRNDKTKIAISAIASPVLYNNITDGAIMVFKDVSKEKEIDRMKTEFIALASHQLRTPLSAIKWFSEMLKNGDAGVLQKQQKEFIVNIYDSCERMIDLVNTLLNISRLESGKLVIDPKPTNLALLIEEIIKELHPKIKEKRLKIITSLHKDIPLISIDPNLMRQVYVNLLTNAIKYSHQNGEIIVILSKKVDQNGSEIVSQVTDSGLGIPKKDQKRVFERFFRADNVVKLETEGTGLGLYLIKKIIEVSNGNIWFESEENNGTSFWFSLPLNNEI